MSFTYSFAVKKLFRFEKGQFKSLNIGFHGDTFVAREHNTNGMFFIFH